MVPVETDAMVPTQENCAADEAKVLCIIRDMTSGDTYKFNMNLPASTLGKQFIEDVAKKLGYEPGTFLLIYEQDLPEEVKVNDMLDQTLTLICSKSLSRRNNFTVMEKDGISPVKVESKESADSGVGLCYIGSSSMVIDNRETSSVSCMPSYSYASAVIKSDTGYVGLVNQAMTCYLNSLLQSLYMTPEFRNAVYRWEFDYKGDPTLSIPYQLQRLFLQLQTSKRRSVETTDITRSFGWDSSEAWQQHDVQELCRVMFDALEKKWVNTDQSDLINQLYQGKIKDYVKCLECQHESARTTPYLDIPLVIRPFATTDAYNSVEEALRAFVEPETLEGNNQYWCETCNKKCNAHKGLKFLSFPYFLTLQLKRFDFDYTTMHRIKLNDMVTFPEILNLNHFVGEDEPGDGKNAGGEVRDPASMSDDSGGGASGGGEAGSPAGPTTGGGAVNGVCATEHGCSASGPLTTLELVEDGPDEGVDIGCSGDNDGTMVSHINEAATNDKNEKQSKSQGQYEYELFSIMIHSGSAVGGHYYAYIKSFSDGQWYSFNDQHVTRITLDDIKKTYGGAGSMQGYYSSAYASSTNAYMLVFRKIDNQCNKDFMQVADFPQHLTQELDNLQKQEERETKQREIDRCTCKIKLFYYSTEQEKMLDVRFEVHKDKTLREATEMAWKLFDLEKVLPLDCVRLVKYDEMHDYIDQSYHRQEDCPMEIILGGVKFSYIFDLLLETKTLEQMFAEYKPGGLTVKVRLVDLPSDHLHQPVTVRAHQTMTVLDFKMLVLQALSIPPASIDKMHCVLEKYSHELKPMLDDTKTLHDESFFKSNKVFVECSGADSAFQSAFQDTKLYRLLDRYKNTISIYVSLPPSKDTDFENTEPSVLESEHELRWTPPGDAVRASDSVATIDATNMTVGQSEQCSLSSDLDDEGIGESDSDIRARSCHSREGAATMPTEMGCGPLHLHSTNDIHSYISESIHRQNLADARDLAGAEPGAKSGIDDVTGGGDRGDAAQTELDGSVHNGGTSSSGGSSSTLVDCGKDTPGGASDEDVAKLPCENWELEDSGKESAENSDEEYRRYFCATLTKSTDPSERALTVHVDKRITLGALKKELEPFVGSPSDRFKIYRVFGDNQEYETIRLNETLAAYGDDSRITIKLGQALKKGEYRVRVYQLKVNEQEPYKLLVESIFAKGMTVLDSKKVILKDMAAQGCKPLPPLERCRLRRCSWKNPTTIFADSKVYEEDIQVGPNWEIFLEVLDGVEKLVDQNQLAVYVRRWWLSTYEVAPFNEIILDSNSIEQLKNKISEVSGIDPENVEFAKGRGTFPCDVSVLDIQQELEWNPSVSCINSWPLSIIDDGAVLYYRDKTEELAELTEEKRNIIQQRENTRLRTMGRIKVKYSPRKERALKIYTDDTPSRPATSSRN